MVRVMVIGTHYQQTNGYAKVMFNMINTLLTQEHFVIGYMFHKNGGMSVRPEIKSPRFITHDVLKNGVDTFGVSDVLEFVKLCAPDVVIVYNDLLVVSEFIKVLSPIKTIYPECQLYAYIDIVYPRIKQTYKDSLRMFDRVYTFLDCWKSEIPNSVCVESLPHGVDNSVGLLDPKRPRQQFNLPLNVPIILNVNRNQPRKRYDILAMSLAMYFQNNIKSPLKCVVATDTYGAWDLCEIFKDAFERHDISMDDKVLIVNTSNKLTDDVLNVLYNACDIGINVCDGEGFGLCNLEHGSLGKPQILTDLPSFKEIYGEGAIYAKVQAEYYADSTRDAIGGLAKMASPSSVAECIESVLRDEVYAEKSTAIARACEKYRIWFGGRSFV